MNIQIPARLKQQYHKLSTWKKIFINDYYKSMERLNASKNKEETINSDIDEELEKLYALVEDQSYFEIEIENNEYLEKEYENELNAIIARGNQYQIDSTIRNKKLLIKNMSKRYSEFLKEEYRHIVDVVKNSRYDNAFKYLILNETLDKIYKKDKEKIFISKRETNKSIAEHMILNYDVLDFIYKNIDNCSNFANLYFEAIEYSKRISLLENKINIDVNTYGKGKWIKFEGKKDKDPNFSCRVNSLRALVANTNWCTKDLASVHLASGDFYVFVDNDNKPHLAVKMMGSSIDEVRGILSGQRIEPEYEDVIKEFLVKNRDIKNGEEWLKNQNWNDELKIYIDLLEKGIILDENEIDHLKEIMFDYREYRSHGGINIYHQKLYNLIMENDYIIDYIIKQNGEDVDDLNIVSKYKDLEKRTLTNYDELEQFLTEFYLNDYEYLNSDLARGFCSNIISKIEERIVSDEVIDLCVKKVEENGNEFIEDLKVEVYSDGNLPQIKNTINSSYIYKRLESLDTYEELKKILDFLYTSDYGKIENRINKFNPRIKKIILERLQKDKIIDIISNKLEEYEDLKYVDFDEIEKYCKKNKNNKLFNIFNSVYILKMIDKADSYEQLEKIINHLYDVGINGNLLLSELFYKDKIKEKLQEDRVKNIIANKFNCPISDVVFCDGKHINENNSYDKYYYGEILLGCEDFADIHKPCIFNARGVIGQIRSLNNSYSNYVTIRLPNLEFCGRIFINEGNGIICDKLQKANEISVRNVNKISFPSLVKADTIICDKCDNLDFKSLKMAKKLYVSNAKKVDLSSLKGVVEEFVIKKTDDCDSSNLKFVNGVAEVKEVGCCLLSSLETVKDLIAGECNYLDISSLANIDRYIKLRQINIVDSSNIERVNGTIDLSGVNGMDLSNLNELKGGLVIIHCNLKGLPKSENIKSKIITSKKNR